LLWVFQQTLFIWKQDYSCGNGEYGYLLEVCISHTEALRCNRLDCGCRHVKNVPGQKTNKKESVRLCRLLLVGLLKLSYFALKKNIEDKIFPPKKVIFLRNYLILQKIVFLLFTLIKIHLFGEFTKLLNPFFLRRLETFPKAVASLRYETSMKVELHQSWWMDDMQVLCGN